jgi:hyperosmotically inducible periplasmic protein
MKRTLILTAFALAAALGCDQNNRPADVRPDRRSEMPPAATSPAPPGRETASNPSALPAMNESDRALAQRVEQILKEDAALAPAAQKIRVHASNGQVTLTGSVSSQEEKKELENKAQQVAGVTQVNNQLTVG